MQMFTMPLLKQHDINDNSSKEAGEKLSMSEMSCDSEINFSTLLPDDQQKWYENKRIRIVVSLISYSFYNSKLYTSCFSYNSICETYPIW